MGSLAVIGCLLGSPGEVRSRGLWLAEGVGAARAVRLLVLVAVDVWVQLAAAAAVAAGCAAVMLLLA